MKRKWLQLPRRYLQGRKLLLLSQFLTIMPCGWSLWERDLDGSSIGTITYYKMISVTYLINCRKLKTSFKTICTLPSYEELSRHWKSEIVVNALPLFQPDSDVVVGMYHYPTEFVPKYMARWLNCMDMEGSLPSPGFYTVKFKVSF